MKNIEQYSKAQQEEIKIVMRTRKEVVEAMHGNVYPLMCRWQEEKEYEDLKDYALPLEPLLPKNVTIIKMTSRPFGFKFQIEGYPNLVHHFRLLSLGDGRYQANIKTTSV